MVDIGGYMRDTSRDKDMIRRFKSGETLASIGKSYGISGERVRQILKLNNITGKDGGKTIKGIETRERKRKEKEWKYNNVVHPIWGCTKAVRDTYSEDVQKAYYEHWHNAVHNDPIDWDFTLPEWWEMWEESGKWEQRGRSANGYVMTRIDLNKGFSPENCYITTLSVCCRHSICHALGW